MKKILAIIILALAAFAAMSCNNKQLAVVPADIPTYTQTFAIDDVAWVEEDQEFFLTQAQNLSKDGSRNVVLVFEEEGGWNESIVLTFFDREDGVRLWQAEREYKAVVPSPQGYGMVETYRALIEQGEMHSFPQNL